MSKVSSSLNDVSSCEVRSARRQYHASCKKMDVTGIRAARDEADDYLLRVAANAIAAGRVPVFKGADQCYALRRSAVNEQCYSLTCFCDTAILWTEDPVELLDLPNHVNGLFVDGACESTAELQLAHLRTLESAIDAQVRMATDEHTSMDSGPTEGVTEESGYAVFRALASLRGTQSTRAPGLRLSSCRGVTQIHFNQVPLAAFDGKRRYSAIVNVLKKVGADFVNQALTQIGSQLGRRFPEQITFNAAMAQERTLKEATPSHIIQIAVGGTVGEIELHFDHGLPSATLRTGSPDNPRDYISASLTDETLDGLALKLQSTLELHQHLQSSNTAIREPQRNSVVFSRLDLSHVSSHLAKSAPPRRGWSQGQ
jgi:hypothetical protein